MDNDFAVAKYNKSLPQDVWWYAVFILLRGGREGRKGGEGLSQMRTGESVWEGRGHFMPKQLPSSSTALPIPGVEEGEREVSVEINIRAVELSVFKTSAFRRPPEVSWHLGSQHQPNMLRSSAGERRC